MCAGVGKTYHMLRDGEVRRKEGVDAIIGLVETHQRPETEALCRDWEILPRKTLTYRGITLSEFDLDAALQRNPRLILLDELAHTNAPGSRHQFRYQDVEELLLHGIDVHTTVNVQHLNSLSDIVYRITGVRVRETVPDPVLNWAHEMVLVDVTVDTLMKRFREGKVYQGEQSHVAMRNFFTPAKIIALREVALRVVAEHVDRQARDHATLVGQTSGPRVRPRFLVAAGPTLASAALIRSAGRLARSLDAEWVVVTVRGDEEGSQELPEQLRTNLDLARELGARIRIIVADKIVSGILDAAREEDATQVLVGKAASGMRGRKNRILKELLANSGDIDVYVVGVDQPSESRRNGWFLPGALSPVRQYGAGLGAVVGTTLVGMGLQHHVSYQSIGLLFLLVSALLPLRLGVGPMVVTALLGALCWNFFFIPPYYTVYIQDPADVLMVGLFLITATVAGFLSSRSHAKARALARQQHRTSALFALTRDLGNARSQDEVVHTAMTHFESEFGGQACVVLGQPDGDLAIREHPASHWSVSPKELAVAAWCYWNEKKAGAGTATLPGAEATYYPLTGPRYPVGVLGWRHPLPKTLTPDQEDVLQNFLRQISSALEREFLHELARQSVVITESERLYKTIFNSISHELRTPLTIIMSTIDHLRHKVTDPADRALLLELATASDRLRQLVDNLLNMTRIESGHIRIAADWCDLRDVIRCAVSSLEEAHSAHHLHLHTDPALPCVRVDGGLIEHAIRNVVRNAMLYTPPGTTIDVHARYENGHVRIDIVDDGPGVPTESLERMFEKFYRVPGSPAGGTGIGLAIVRGFIEAHGGEVRASCPHGSGLCITMDIPVPSADAISLDEEEDETENPDRR